MRVMASLEGYLVVTQSSPINLRLANSAKKHIGVVLSDVEGSPALSF
jgi:hypothetical protein